MRNATRVGLTIGVLLLALAVVGPVLRPDATGLSPLGALHAPDRTVWLGTDQYSRDLFARLAQGARTSLGIALLAVLVASFVGTALGLAAGGTRGVVSLLARQVIDLGLAVPRVIVLLVVGAGLGALSWPVLALAIGLTGWPSVARFVSGEAQRLRQALWIDAARALGATPPRILWRHLLPASLPPVLIAATLGLADAVLLEAGLSFLGLGIRAPEPSWGGMILESREYLATAPRLLLVPALALVTATAAATLLGEAMQRALQPDHS